MLLPKRALFYHPTSPFHPTPPPPPLLSSSPHHLPPARKVLVARRTANFAAFFRLLRAAPYVEACAMSKFVGGDGGVRAVAIRALHNAWRQGGAAVPLAELTSLLCCDDDDETAALLEDFGVPTEVLCTHASLVISLRFDIRRSAICVDRAWAMLASASTFRAHVFCLYSL